MKGEAPTQLHHVFSNHQAENSPYIYDPIHKLAFCELLKNMTYKFKSHRCWSLNCHEFCKEEKKHCLINKRRQIILWVISFGCWKALILFIIRVCHRGFLYDKWMEIILKVCAALNTYWNFLILISSTTYNSNFTQARSTVLYDDTVVQS